MGIKIKPAGSGAVTGTADRVAVFGPSGLLIASTVTVAELELLSGLSGDILTTTNAKTVSNKTFAQDLVFDANNVRDIGSSGVKAKDAYLAGQLNAATGHFTGNVTIDGDLTVNGTTTTVNSTTLEVTDANILVNNGGNDATSEGAGLTIERTTNNGSLIFANASATKFRAGLAGSEIDLVGTTSTQTLTNKTVVAANNTITTAAAGNLSATELNAALNELQLDIDGREPALGFTPEDVANKDTDVNLAANSDTLYPSQKAVKAYVDLNSGLTAWKKAGNAGTTPGTDFVGTSDAQALYIKTNSVTQLIFEASGGWGSNQGVVPADTVSKNQYALVTYVNPGVATTTANHTGVLNQITYDDANLGYSFGGNIIAVEDDLTFNGDGTLNFAAVQYQTANFNNGGTTNTFHGQDLYVNVASGTAVNNYVGTNHNLNSTSGLFSNITGINNNIALTGTNHGQVNGLANSLNFSGADVNAQGVAGINDYQQYNDSASTVNGINSFSSGIDFNDSATTSGINAFNAYINARDTSDIGDVNLVNVSLSQTDSSVSSNVNGINVNLQYLLNAQSGGVSLINAYGNVSDSAQLNALTVLQANPEIQGSAVLSNYSGLNISGQIRGNSTVTNITGGYINPQMSGNSSADNFLGLMINPQVNGSASLLNELVGIKILPQSAVDLNGAVGLNIDLGSVTLDAAYIAAGGQKKALTINDGAIEAGINYHIPSAASYFQNNYIGGGVYVDSGTPVSAFGFGNNFAVTVNFQDDWTIDAGGLGFIDVGFVGSIVGATGKTMARWTGALGGAGNPSGNGTLTDAIMFRAAGILPQGGSLAVTNMYGFQVDENLFGSVGTNKWGFYENTSSVENHMTKLAIGTSTKKVANSDTALDIGNKKMLIPGRVTTAEKSALTGVESAIVYDTDLGKHQFFDNTNNWADLGGGTGAGSSDSSMEITNLGLAASVAANALTISLKQKDGSSNPASGTGEVKIAFRDATSTIGGYVQRTVSASLSTVVSSGSTLGSVSGKKNCIYVYAIDNAGSVELAYSAQKFVDEGSLYSTTAEGGAGAADSKNVLYSTTARSNVAIRLIGRIESTQATAGTWATAPSKISVRPFEEHSPRSEVWVTSMTGRASTNTAIGYFATAQKNVGSAITYASSATNGDSFTINEDGVYSIFTQASLNGANNFGISLNSVNLSTGITGIPVTEMLAASQTPGADSLSGTSVTLNLVVGDVVRSHIATSAGMGANSNYAQFRIVKVSN